MSGEILNEDPRGRFYASGGSGPAEVQDIPDGSEVAASIIRRSTRAIQKEAAFSSPHATLRDSVLKVMRTRKANTK